MDPKSSKYAEDVCPECGLCEAAATTTTSTLTMTEPPTTTTTGAPMSDCADEWPSVCAQYVDYCSPYTTLNNKPIYDACPVTCCQGCAKDLPSCPKPGACMDEMSHTCEMYGSQYCPTSAPNPGQYCDWVRIGETLYRDACKKTCGYC